MRSSPAPASMRTSGAGAHWKPWNFGLTSGQTGSSPLALSSIEMNRAPVLFVDSVALSALPETSVSVSPAGSTEACRLAPAAGARARTATAQSAPIPAHRPSVIMARSVAAPAARRPWTFV